MHIVAFRTPIETTARELRQWMIKRPKGDWFIEITALGHTHQLTNAKGHWRKEEDFWDLVIALSRFPKKAAPEMAFQDANDTMLFRLTWG